MAFEAECAKLSELLERAPAIDVLGSGRFNDGIWWVKFKIDIRDPQAWHVVQWLGYMLNYNRLPTVFKPVSPPPYLNGGPRTYLSWVVESTGSDYTPDECAEDLDSELPHPVGVASAWVEDEADARGLLWVRQWVRRGWREWKARTSR